MTHIETCHAASCTCAMHPLPSVFLVRDARDAYLRENGFTVDGYDARWADGAFLGLRVRFPNTARRRWGIRFHDLHHVATGYGTDLAGEGEVSAWEVRGLQRLGVYVAGLILLGCVVGALIAPLRTRRAARAPGRTLFGLDVAYDDLLAMTVGELRALLGLPEAGLATVPRGRHEHAPQPLSRIEAPPA